jgi:hypothetical protein
MLGPDFMDRYPCPERPVAVAVQALIDSHRRGSVISESADRAMIREALIKRLSSKPQVEEQTEIPEGGRLALKMATENFNSHYSKQMSSEQMELIDAYVVGGLSEDYTRFSRLAKLRVDELVTQLMEFKKIEASDDHELAERIDRVMEQMKSLDSTSPSSLAEILDAQVILNEVRK